jgi:hypothetical protein
MRNNFLIYINFQDMKSSFFKVSALIAFVCFCIANIALVFSQNGKISSNLNLTEIESCEAACESYPNGDNGDCISTPQGGFCEDSWFIHD